MRIVSGYNLELLSEDSLESVGDGGGELGSDVLRGFVDVEGLQVGLSAANDGLSSEQGLSVVGRGSSTGLTSSDELGEQRAGGRGRSRESASERLLYTTKQIKCLRQLQCSPESRVFKPLKVLTIAHGGKTFLGHLSQRSCGLKAISISVYWYQ